MMRMEPQQESWKIQVPFHIDYCLNCGQAFRWKKRGNHWFGFINDNLYRIEYDASDKTIRTLRITRDTAKAPGGYEEENRLQVERYFGLNDSLSAIRESILSNLRENGYNWFARKFDEIFSESLGLRILRQDVWEVAVSFLLSTQTNIPALEQKLASLCRRFPENEIRFEGESFYRFPTKAALATLCEDDFKRLGFGYRSAWLCQLVKRFNESEFHSLRTETYERQLSFLLSFPGIGYKVAHCILLFGYSVMKAFPVDIWISRWIKEVFDIDGAHDRLTAWGQTAFGDYAGYAQEYVFNFCRNLAPGGR